LLLEEACAQHVDINQNGPSKWICQSKVDPNIVIVALSQEAMVTMALRSPEVRSPQSTTADLDAIALLKRNATLSGGVKFTVTHDSEIGLRAEFSSISCGPEEMATMIGAAVAGFHEALTPDSPLREGESFRMTSSPSEPLGPEHESVKDLCIQVGIDFHESADGGLRIPLMTSRGRRLTVRAFSRQDQVHLRLGLGSLPESVESCAAVAQFLLSLAGGLKLVRPLLEETNGEWELAYEVVHPKGLPNPEQFQDALAALSMAGQMSLAELEALHHEDLARHYIELRAI
jgi:hypothetical protein